MRHNSARAEGSREIGTWDRLAALFPGMAKCLHPMMRINRQFGGKVAHLVTYNAWASYFFLLFVCLAGTFTRSARRIERPRPSWRNFWNGAAVIPTGANVMNTPLGKGNLLVAAAIF